MEAFPLSKPALGVIPETWGTRLLTPRLRAGPRDPASTGYRTNPAARVRGKPALTRRSSGHLAHAFFLSQHYQLSETPHRDLETRSLANLRKQLFLGSHTPERKGAEPGRGKAKGEGKCGRAGHRGQEADPARCGGEAQKPYSETGEEKPERVSRLPLAPTPSPT